MLNLISSIHWQDKNEKLDELLEQAHTLTMHPMDQGFEAEVMKITSDQESFVMKIWSKHSKPDIRSQYHLLHVLSERGLSVSKPLGWGTNPNGDQVLLTTFDGSPITRVNKKKMTEFARMLRNIHKTDVKEMGDFQLPKFDFIDYFFPGVREHSDVLQVLTQVTAVTTIQQDQIIHGDFHLGNIIENNDRYTVIDWTNGQLGDPRYDFAWSFILLKIHISDRHAEMFRTAYLAKNSIPEEELERFEALACLRWVLLHRYGNVPIGPDTMERAESFMRSNPFLSAFAQDFLYRKI